MWRPGGLFTRMMKRRWDNPGAFFMPLSLCISANKRLFCFGGKIARIMA